MAKTTVEGLLGVVVLIIGAVVEVEIVDVAADTILLTFKCSFSTFYNEYRNRLCILG